MPRSFSRALVVALQLGLVRLAAAQQGTGWGESVEAPPIRTLTIAMVLGAVTVLGAMAMYLLSMEEDHWKRGRHS